MNNSLIKTVLDCCQLCDSFTIMPPAIPVPVREKETTMLDLQVTYTRVSTSAGKVRQPASEWLVQQLSTPAGYLYNKEQSQEKGTDYPPVWHRPAFIEAKLTNRCYGKE